MSHFLASVNWILCRFNQLYLCNNRAVHFYTGRQKLVVISSTHLCWMYGSTYWTVLVLRLILPLHQLRKHLLPQRCKCGTWTWSFQTVKGVNSGGRWGCMWHSSDFRCHNMTNIGASQIKYTKIILLKLINEWIYPFKIHFNNYNIN